MKSITHQQRKSIRLKGYDYTQPGAYFVTLVTWQRECLFGEVVNGEMRLNEFGEIVAETWQWLPIQYPYVETGKFCVMPNHVHGIIVIDYDEFPRRGESRLAPTVVAPTVVAPTVIAPTVVAPTGNAYIGNAPTEHTPKTGCKIKPLGQLVGAFKTVSAKRINLRRDSIGVPVWQRNFYERIVRDETEWERIHAYIETNSLNWETDEENR